MDPKIDQVWEWYIDREHINVFVIKKIIPSPREIEVTCEIIEGENPGSIFNTSISSFTNPNWRYLYPSVDHHFDGVSK